MKLSQAFFCQFSVAMPLLLLLMLAPIPGVAFRPGPDRIKNLTLLLILLGRDGQEKHIRPDVRLEGPLHVNGRMYITASGGEYPLTKGWKLILLMDEAPETLRGGPPYPQLKDQTHLYRFNEDNRVKAPWENPWLKPFYWVWFRIFPPKAAEIDGASYYEVPLTKGTHRLQLVVVDKDGKPYTPMVASGVYNIVIE